jgi:hypothetical protein
MAARRAHWLVVLLLAAGAAVVLIGARAEDSRTPSAPPKEHAKPAAAALDRVVPEAVPETVPETVNAAAPPRVRTADQLALDEMQALVRQNRISQARARAESFYQDHPASPYAGDVERLTGVHPRPPLPE